MTSKQLSIILGLLGIILLIIILIAIYGIQKSLETNPKYEYISAEDVPIHDRDYTWSGDETGISFSDMGEKD